MEKEAEPYPDMRRNVTVESHDFAFLRQRPTPQFST